MKLRWLREFSCGAQEALTSDRRRLFIPPPPRGRNDTLTVYPNRRSFYEQPERPLCVLPGERARASRACAREIEFPSDDDACEGERHRQDAHVAISIHQCKI